MSNRDLLAAFWYLAYYQERAGAPSRRVNYAALDVEELGSVYESLLGVPSRRGHRCAGSCCTFDLIFGSERKTTGSFYTPPELVNELIESALMPVVRQRLAAAAVADKRDGTGTKHQQAALLSLKIIDIACGSGHMLLAAARRVGKELARLRTGEDEPAPERIRESIRDVISHCIYGVDRNPLAVDLCRVALWLESHTAGKPLTFLDHRIRCGDSLVGVFDLGVLAQGIPDKAFDPCEGDDKATARNAARQNREERRGAQDLFALRDSGEAEALTRHSRDVDAIPDDSPELIRRKEGNVRGQPPRPGLAAPETSVRPLDCGLLPNADCRLPLSLSSPPPRSPTTSAAGRLTRGFTALPGRSRSASRSSIGRWNFPKCLRLAVSMSC